MKKSIQYISLSQATKMSKIELGQYILKLKFEEPWHDDIKSLQVIYDNL